MDIQSRPIWAPNNGRPRDGFVHLHRTVRWTSIVERPTPSTIYVHMAPRPASNSVHVLRPVRSTIPVHLAPCPASNSVHVLCPVRSTIPAHMTPWPVSNPVHLTVHNSRLGAATIPGPVRLHRAVRWPTNFSSPIGRPLPRSGRPHYALWASMHRPAVLRPCIMPHVDARYYARVAWGHVYVGTTKNPSPKGERLRLLVVKPLGLIPV